MGRGGWRLAGQAPHVWSLITLLMAPSSLGVDVRARHCRLGYAPACSRGSGLGRPSQLGAAPADGEHCHRARGLGTAEPERGPGQHPDPGARRARSGRSRCPTSWPPRSHGGAVGSCGPARRAPGIWHRDAEASSPVTAQLDQEGASGATSQLRLDHGGPAAPGPSPGVSSHGRDYESVVS